MDHKQMVHGVDVSKDKLDIVAYDAEATIDIGNAPGAIVVGSQRWLQGAWSRGEATGRRNCAPGSLLRHPPICSRACSGAARRRCALAKRACKAWHKCPRSKAGRQILLASFKRRISNVEPLIRAELARGPELLALHRRLTRVVGVGKILSAQLVACLSRWHFARVASFIAYTGLDPRPDDSGVRRGKRQLSKRGPALLRCLLYNAGMSAANSKLFKPGYLALRARGLQSTEAIVVLARRIARIAFAPHKSGQDFDAQKHLRVA